MVLPQQLTLKLFCYTNDIYIYIYIQRERERESRLSCLGETYYVIYYIILLCFDHNYLVKGMNDGQKESTWLVFNGRLISINVDR